MYFSLQVFAGAKPLLDKTLGILVEGLIDTFLSLFDENQSNNLKSLDANGFCQLMLEVVYNVLISSLKRSCIQLLIFSKILLPVVTHSSTVMESSKQMGVKMNREQ